MRRADEVPSCVHPFRGRLIRGLPAQTNGPVHLPSTLPIRVLKPRKKAGSWVAVRPDQIDLGRIPVLTVGGAVLYDTTTLRYGGPGMLYRVELLLRSNVDDEALHEILVRANTYAIVEAVDASRDTGSEDRRFTARIDAPSAEAALGATLTVLAQTSGQVGLVEEGSVRRVAIDREEPFGGGGSEQVGSSLLDHPEGVTGTPEA